MGRCWRVGGAGQTGEKEGEIGKTVIAYSINILHADMIAVTIQSNKIVSNEVKDN